MFGNIKIVEYQSWVFFKMNSVFNNFHFLTFKYSTEIKSKFFIGQGSVHYGLSLLNVP